MRQIILTGKQLRNEGSTFPMESESKAEFRIWIKSQAVHRLFGDDSDWLCERLLQGDGQLKGHYCIWHHRVFWRISENLRSVITNTHTFEALYDRTLGKVRTYISSLLCGDQSDAANTNAFLDESMFEITVYDVGVFSASLDYKQWFNESKGSSLLPFDLSQSIMDTKLSSFASRLETIVNEARDVGINLILKTLPPRPSSKHIWNSDIKMWGLYQSDPSYRFKGVDDSDF